jgi:hypothetical protein
MIDLEHLHPRQFGHAPGAPVVTRAEDDELRRASSDRVADRSIDGRSAKADHVGHPARHLEAHAALSFSGRALGLREAAFPLLVQKDAGGRIVEIRNVRQPGIRHRAAECDKMSGPARALSSH